MSKNHYEGIHPYVVTRVRYHARRLIRHPTIHGVEVEDLEQELMLDYVSRKQAYDPEKAQWSTFVDRILNHKCASLIEAAHAQKRGSGICDVSLESWLEDKDGEHDALPDPKTEDLTGRDLQIDLQKTVQHMPPHLVLLLIDLRTLSISEISRKTKTPRSTLYGTLSDLRKSLMAQGFGEYLHWASDSLWALSVSNSLKARNHAGFSRKYKTSRGNTATALLLGRRQNPATDTT